MPGERKPAILLISNPQTSKDETLLRTDLLTVPPFKKIVDRFDRALGIPENDSLNPKRQIASVVMSVAAHTAFVEGLMDRTHPGLLDVRKRPFNLILTGHSIGEMASLVEAGVCKIPTMAWMLNERERITEGGPVRAGLRQMVAITGANPDQIEANLHYLTERFAGEVELFMANYNTKRQTVVALRVLKGEVGTALEKLGRFIPEIKDPNDEGKSLFPRIRLYPLLPNGFHTALMKLEEAEYRRTITPVLNDKYFNAPSRRTVYSPTLPGWLNSLKQTYYVTEHILTNPVKFHEAVEELKEVPELVAAVTADVLNTTPNMTKENGIGVPVLNIVNKKSLNEAIEVTTKLIKQAA